MLSPSYYWVEYRGQTLISECSGRHTHDECWFQCGSTFELVREEVKVLYQVSLFNEKLSVLQKLPSDLVPWPDGWPRYKQACFGSWNDACDALVGPCSCGAWHHKGEFVLEIIHPTGPVLYRNNELITDTITPEEYEEVLLSYEKGINYNG